MTDIGNTEQRGPRVQDEGGRGEDAIHGDTDCKEQSEHSTTDDGPTSAHGGGIWAKYKGEVLQKANIGAGRSLREKSDRRVEQHGVSWVEVSVKLPVDAKVSGTVWKQEKWPEAGMEGGTVTGSRELGKLSKGRERQ